jgi:protein-S-isoprenylcysteine O-methyltransferase Ste14
MLTLRVPPVVVWLVCAGGAWLLTRATPWLGGFWNPRLATLPAPGGVLTLRHALVALLTLAGLALGLLGVWALGRSGTTVNPHRPDRTSALVTTGVYAVTRNPMYTGLVLVLLAWTAWLAHPAGLVGVVAFVLYIDRFQTRAEEAALRAQFGAAFDRYRARVPRWL